MSQLDLSRYSSGTMPAARVQPDPHLDHEQRIRELEASRLRQHARLENVEAQLTALVTESARNSDVEELKAARASQLELDRKNEEAIRAGEKLAREKAEETRSRRLWGLFVLVLGTILGVGGKIAGDYWVGPKTQNPPVQSDQ